MKAGAGTERPTRHENPVVDPIGGFPPEGRFFPLTAKSNAKADWAKFFLFLEMMRIAMLQRGVAAEGKAMTAIEAMKNLKANLFTLVLATVECPGWSISWAKSVVSVVADAYSDCSKLIMIAIQGGPACQEEVAFIDIIVRMLGFSEKVVEFEGPGVIIWAWDIKRPGASDFRVGLLKRTAVSGMSMADLPFTEDNSYAPNLARVAIVSCAEQWAPQKEETVYLPEILPSGERVLREVAPGTYLATKDELAVDAPRLGYRIKNEFTARHPNLAIRYGKTVEGELADGWLTIKLPQKPARRLDDDGKTVNEVLNGIIVEELDKLAQVAAVEGHCTLKEKWLDYCNKIVAIRRSGARSS